MDSMRRQRSDSPERRSQWFGYTPAAERQNLKGATNISQVQANLLI